MIGYGDFSTAETKEGRKDGRREGLVVERTTRWKNGVKNVLACSSNFLFAVTFTSAAG